MEMVFTVIERPKFGNGIHSHNEAYFFFIFFEIWNFWNLEMLFTAMKRPKFGDGIHNLKEA